MTIQLGDSWKSAGKRIGVAWLQFKNVIDDLCRIDFVSSEIDALVSGRNQNIAIKEVRAADLESDIVSPTINLSREICSPVSPFVDHERIKLSAL